jgi:rhamnogalacturonan endolyase
MAVADNRQRYMPLPDDRLPERSVALATPEAVLLVNPVEPEFKGEVVLFFFFFWLKEEEEEYR